MSSDPIGILALQGDFAAHAAILARLGQASRLVRGKGDLDDLSGLILPGGESTTIQRELRERDLSAAILELAAHGTPVLGTCAGAILMAREVRSPAAPGLALLDIVVARNAYGRQTESFVDDVAAPELPGGAVRGVFIRAPAIMDPGAARVLGKTRGAPVWVRQGARMACTFHPELTRDTRVHRYFLELTREELAA